MSALPVPPPKYFPYPFANDIIGAEAEDDLQFLWSLKQVASIYRLDTLGQRDWYGWMQPLVVAAQQPDGSWRGRFSGPVETCYALLFLAPAPQGDVRLRLEIERRLDQGNPAQRQGAGSARP